MVRKYYVYLKWLGKLLRRCLVYVEERGQAEGSISIQRTRLAKEKWKSQEDQNKQETRRTANSWQKEKDLQTGDSGLYHTTALYPELIKTKPMNGDRWLVQVKHLWRKSSSFDRIV